MLEELGAHVEEISIPALDHALAISSTILFVEAAEVHLQHLRDRPDDIGDDVRQRFEVGALTPAQDYIKAQKARRVFNARMAEAMQAYDVLLAPTTTFGAPPIGERESVVAGEAYPTRTLLARLTRPFNLTGQPGVSVPVRLRRVRYAHRHAVRRASLARGHRPPRRPRLRAGHRLAHPPPARLAAATDH